MLLSALLLIGASTSAQTKPEPAGDLPLAGIQAETALDAFAECFEPRLADDPAIKTPIERRLPFEAIDNDVSIPAFQACRSLLPPSNGADVASDAYQGRLIGMRFMASRNAFYLSRGQINLEIRRRVRPYLSCIESNISEIDLSKLEAGEAKSRIISNVKSNCEPSKPQVQFTGSENERRMRGNFLTGYVTSFAEDILAFRLKAPL